MKIFLISKEIMSFFHFFTIFKKTLEVKKLLKLNLALIVSFIWIAKIAIQNEGKSLSEFAISGSFIGFVFIFIFFNSFHLFYAFVYYHIQKDKYLIFENRCLRYMGDTLEVEKCVIDHNKLILHTSGAGTIELWFSNINELYELKKLLVIDL